MAEFQVPAASFAWEVFRTQQASQQAKQIKTQVAKPRLTKSEIIRQTIQLLSNKGFHETSMNEIATQCGIKKASLYHHFPSKEAIVLALIDEIRIDYQQKFIGLNVPNDISAKLLAHLLEEKLFSHHNGQLIIRLVVETSGTYPTIASHCRLVIDECMQKLLVVLKLESTKGRKMVNKVMSNLLGYILLEKIFQPLGHVGSSQQSSIISQNNP